MGAHWLIAGTGRGIGHALAQAAAARGVRVTASLRDPAKHDAFLREAAGWSGDIDALVFDSRNAQAIAAAASAFGDRPLDAVIVNSGAYGPQRQTTQDMDFPGALDLFDVNALGPLRVAQAFLPMLKRGKNPRLVFVSSVLGSMANDGTYNVAYRASKAALNKFAQCLAQDLQAQGVTVIALHPGWVRTAMGGPDAPLTPKDSAEAIVALVERLAPDDTGRFLDWRGEEIAW